MELPFKIEQEGENIKFVYDKPISQRKDFHQPGGPAYIIANIDQCLLVAILEELKELNQQMKRLNETKPKAVWKSICASCSKGWHPESANCINCLV